MSTGKDFGNPAPRGHDREPVVDESGRERDCGGGGEGGGPRDLHGRPYTAPELRRAWFRVQAELAGPLTERSRAAIRRALRTTDSDHTD